jgi:hypothetical protein
MFRGEAASVDGTCELPLVRADLGLYVLEHRASVLVNQGGM